MTTRSRGSALLAAGTILLAGCASSQAESGSRPTGRSTATSTPTAAMTPSAAMTPGMVMPDGATMSADQMPAQVAKPGPSAAARMICSAEIRADIAEVLALKSVPQPASRWSDNVYTCTYRLPMGTFVLSVSEAKNATTARAFAAGLRRGLGQARSIAGLTETAFSTPLGLVTLVKDNDTLQVDATRLPAQFGAQQQKRTDFAYEIASDILGCWTEG